MSVPITAICEHKRVRSDGTSVIFLQWCFNSKIKPLLNTELEIPPGYWNKTSRTVANTLPAKYGDAKNINKEVRRMLKLATDLILLSERKKVYDKVAFIKETFKPDLDLEALEKEEQKFVELAKPKEARTNKDFYFQLQDYIKIKGEGSVTKQWISMKTWSIN